MRAPAIYYYFESREDLIREVMTAGQRRLREHVQSALDSAGRSSPPLERISTAVRAHLEVELELSDFATALTHNLGQLPTELRELLRAETRGYMDLWRRLLKAAQEAGDIDPELDLRAARMLVIGALNWTVEWWRPEQGPIEGVITTAQHIIRNGLRR